MRKRNKMHIKRERSFDVFLFFKKSGSSFPLAFVHTSFWTPKRLQGTAISVYTGTGALGNSVFTLIVPFIINGVGIVWCYALWCIIQACLVVYILIFLVDPPYLSLLRELRVNGATVLVDWDAEAVLQHGDAIDASGRALDAVMAGEEDGGGVEMTHMIGRTIVETTSRPTEIALSSPRQSEGNDLDAPIAEDMQASDNVKSKAVSVVSKPWDGLYVWVEEIRRLALTGGQEIFPRSSLWGSVKLSVSNWRVWLLFLIQVSFKGVRLIGSHLRSLRFIDILTHSYLNFRSSVC